MVGPPCRQWTGIVSGLFPDADAENQIVSACEFVPSESTEATATTTPTQGIPYKIDPTCATGTTRTRPHAASSNERGRSRSNAFRVASDTTSVMISA